MSLILNGLQLARNIFRTNLSNKVVPTRLICSSSVQYKQDEVPPEKRRNREIPVETSIRYLKSSAYEQTYKGYPVWKFYRRNFRGPYPPRHTRKTCIRGGVISTGNPCPICRDEYLILDYRNIDLLKQFISEHTGSVLSYRITGICRKKQKELLIAIYKAYDIGLITFDVPIVQYNYADWYTPSEHAKGNVTKEKESKKLEDSTA